MDKKKKVEEDYGDYVTRCICELEHDDGYMIACDVCGVWQHIECMQVDPKNLPDNYLCERCEPRSIDRRRARQIQLKKRGALSEMDSSRRSRDMDGKSSSGSLLSPIPLSSRKKRKKGKLPEQPVKIDSSKRQRKDPPAAHSAPSSTKKPKKRLGSKPQPRSRLNSSTGSIQSLLNAATLLEQGDDEREHKPSRLWNTNYSPWSDEYETLAENRVSEAVGRLLCEGEQLSQLKSEAVVYSSLEYQEVCRSVDAESAYSLVDVARRRRGVVADVSIPEDELVTEYKGLVTLKADVLSESVKCLWRESPCPFVYQYDKMADLEVVLDARECGNIARFIRRSCSPNTEVRHFFVEDSLHFGVYALSDLSPQEELTLAFDFQHDTCDYPMECACGQVKTACLIAKTTPAKGGGVPKSCDVEELSSVRVRQRSYSHLLDEDSNSSWTSTASHGRKRRSTRATPLSPKTPTPLSPKLSVPTSREESSDSEGEGEKRRKSLTREERKTEQVWKMFEKMEASAQRKRQNLVSEGSADSAELVTSPLLTRHAHTGRERRTPSTGSRRTQLLTSSGKPRLSSVSSSGDPLSPTFDLPEPFSPPTTPSAHMFTPPLPTHYTPSVDVTPYLHPQYLLQDLVLPWKKAFLRKWECEKLGVGEFPDRYSYWAGSDTPTHYGDLMRERIRGSLKHRWLREYNEGDKENLNTPLPSLPGKKQFLRRWEEETNPMATIPMTTIPMATSLADNLDTQQDDSMEGVVSGCGPDMEGVVSGCGSPLFDEFSDGEEFELPAGGRRRRTSHNKVKDLEPKQQSVSPPTTPSHTPPPHESPSTQSPLEDMEALDDEETTSPLPPHDHVSLCSDISEDSISGTRPTGQTGPKTPQETTPTSPMSPVGPLTPPTLQQSTPDLSSPAIQHVNISDISSDMDGSIGQSSELEVTKPHPHTPPPHTSTDTQPERQMSDSSDVCSEWVRGVGEVEGAKGTFALTPIKRKINLSEYRNRARKPADRKPSTEATPTLPSHIIHYPTLPPQPVVMVTALTPGVAMETGMNLSPIAMTTCVPMTSMAPGVPVTTVGGLPQFEPVSPDDIDNTPSLLPMEGPGGGGVQTPLMVGPLMGSHLPPITTQPSVVEVVGGPLLMANYTQHSLHAPPVVWPVDACNDPRRVSLGERGFVEPRPPASHMPHPHYGMGFPRPPHPPHGQYMPQHPGPGGGYYNN